MQWDRSYTSSDLEDRRGDSAPSFGGGGVPVFGLLRILSLFGWKGILVGLVIAGVVGVGGQCAGTQSGSRGASHGPVASSPQEDELVHFVSFVFDDVQKSWRERIGGYPDAHIVLFRRGVRTACGNASTAVGPFYCPGDRKVYIDLAFYGELRDRFHAAGDFAEAYVIAHEVGHHVQNLRGLLGNGGGNAASVATELQADCLAGAWAKDADRRGLLETGDIDEALNAASQIGDDTLQRETQGYVQPDTFTHGTSAQRSASFKKGFQGGPEACGI